MRDAPISKQWRWRSVILPLLLLTSNHSFAQLVEVGVQIETTWWPRNPSEQVTERRRVETSRCIFGTNGWLIEGEFTRSSKETWWCTATNIVKHVVITKDVPEPKDRSFAGYAPKAGEEFTSIYGPKDKCRLSGLTYVNWLAFCSGAFLKSEGRRLVPPFPGRRNEEDYSDKTRVFERFPGLPERAEIYSSEGDLACLYVVQQSTNFGGLTFPVRFEFSQYELSGTEKPFCRVSATVTSMRLATQPAVPSEILQKARR